MTAFAMKMPVIEFEMCLADITTTTAGTNCVSPREENRGTVLCNVRRMRSGRLAAEGANIGGGCADSDASYGGGRNSRMG